MEEFKHGLKERMNGILFYMVFLTLPILVLINIDSTTLLRTFLNDIVLSIIECLVPINVDLTRFSNILDYIVLIIIELIIILSLDGLFSIIGKRYINKITMCKNGVNHSVDGDEYSAVLIGNNLSWIQNIYTNEGAGGLCLLKKYFKNTNKNYIICQKVGKSQFDRFVLDDKCQELYILGHGSKRSFSVNNENDGKIYYSEYKDAPKKRVIAQLHCAHSVIGENNESLVDLLATDKKNSYVGSGYITFLNEWIYYVKMWIKSMS